MYSPSWLSNELQKVIANENPLNGIKLGITLSKFSIIDVLVMSPM